MKTIKSLMVAALITLGTAGAFAQSSDMFTYGVNNVYVQYNDVKLKGNIDSSLGGFSVGYNRMFGLTEKAPLYVEVGGAFEYANVEETLEVAGVKLGDTEMNLYTFKVPLSIGYQFAIGQSGFSVAPYAGFDLLYHFKGEIKDNQSGETLDIFKDSDDSNIDDSNRFQAGWHAGINLAYKHVFAGVTYGETFNGMTKIEGSKSKLGTTSVSIGYRF
ncbi:outer membrane beta-barrel protein [Bacteroides timonensis]|uniref:outer membrane beta-barrel protein n=1 Tax=Bacteroides timonensis TaxID=1470345 RepID=UPI0004B55D11|nr:outer membrane beta-barrel protein [Bacteroides timonensis]